MASFRSVASLLKGTATYTTLTPPKMKAAYAPTAAADFGHHQEKQTKKAVIKGEYVPVYVVLGMIALSTSLGLYTARHHIMYSPDVRVKKKIREIVPELEDPDRVVDEADKLVKKSFFRKVAHIQEVDTGYMSNPVHRHDAFAHKHHHPRVETLKSVGIDPKNLH